MKETDATIIDAAILAQAQSAIATDEGAALRRLSEREPLLANFMLEKMLVIAGRLALSGAPSEVVNEIDDCIRLLVLIGIEATRLGHYELWKDTAEGEHLRKIVEQEQQTKASDDDDDEIDISDIDF